MCCCISFSSSPGLVNQCCALVEPSNGTGNSSNGGVGEPEIDRNFAFQTVRLAQGVGATTAFVLGATICDVSVQLYVLVALLSTAVLGYIVAEYRLKKRVASYVVSGSRTGAGSTTFTVLQPVVVASDCSGAKSDSPKPIGR